MPTLPTRPTVADRLALAVLWLATSFVAGLIAGLAERFVRFLLD